MTLGNRCATGIAALRAAPRSTERLWRSGLVSSPLHHQQLCRRSHETLSSRRLVAGGDLHAHLRFDRHTAAETRGRWPWECGEAGRGTLRRLARKHTVDALSSWRLCSSAQSGSGLSRDRAEAAADCPNAGWLGRRARRRCIRLIGARSCGLLRWARTRVGRRGMAAGWLAGVPAEGTLASASVGGRPRGDSGRLRASESWPPARAPYRTAGLSSGPLLRWWARSEAGGGLRRAASSGGRSGMLGMQLVGPESRSSPAACRAARSSSSGRGTCSARFYSPVAAAGEGALLYGCAIVASRISRARRWPLRQIMQADRPRDCPIAAARSRSCAAECGGG